MRSPAAKRPVPSGQLMIWAIVFTFLLAMAALVLPQVLMQRQKFALDDRQRFEASLLASDVVEIGKYFLLYEKLVFAEDPMNFNADRAACIRDTWTQSLGVFQNSVTPPLMDACGWYDADAAYHGTHKISCPSGGSIQAFCPVRIRDPNLDGGMLEELLYSKWSVNPAGIGNTRAVTEERPGVYSLEIELRDAFNPARQGINMFRLFSGQKLLRERLAGTALAGLVSNDPAFRATLRIELFSNSSSFVGVASERFAKVTGTVEFSGAQRGLVHHVERSQSLMVLLSTPKDFALFMPYPILANGNETTSWTAAMNMSNEVEIHGRVFFDGDIIYNTIEALPTFFEAVAISGQIRDNAGTVPGPQRLAALQNKFRKGFVTNYSGARYVKDGHCAANGAAGLPQNNLEIINGTRLNCFKEETFPPAAGPIERFQLANYILERLNTDCSNATLTVNQGTVTVTPQAVGGPWTRAPTPGNDCGFPQPYDRPTRYVHGGFRQINASGAYASILSPVERLNVTGANTVIYGTILGGRITTAGANRFYSLASMTPGLPGLGNASTFEELGELNSDQVAAYEGITVPLINTPVVMITGEEG